jgi:uncharacterized membrane protein
VPGRFLSGEPSGTARIEAFSDAVFAIAVTLLALEVAVPSVAERAGGGALFRALGEQWPSLLAYVVSFLVIGLIWSSHHEIFERIARWDHLFLGINVGFLMVVALLPWPTHVLAEYIRSPTQQQVAVLLYSGYLLLMAMLFSLVWEYAARRHRLLDERLSVVDASRITRFYRLNVLLYIVAFLLALLHPYAGLAVLVGIAVMHIIPGPAAPRLGAPPDGVDRS